MPSPAIAAFRKLHESGCFVMPNPWDVGSARALHRLGFEALASTSAGAAWALGCADGEVSLDGMLQHLRDLVAATPLPVNADFANGFADDIDPMARNVSACVQTGVAGLSIEDSTGRAEQPLYDFDHAVARIAAARWAIDAHGGQVVLTGRCESFLTASPDLGETVRRIAAYAEAGADCLYAPFLPDEAAIRAVIRAAGGKPVNVLMPGPGFTVEQLAGLGARRISVGGALARAAWGGFLSATADLKAGAFQPFASIAPFTSLNSVFSAD